MRDFRLPLQSRRELSSSGLLRSEYWQFLTDVSGQPIGPFFKGHSLKMGPKVCPETSARNCHYTLSNIAQERRSRHLSARVKNVKI